MTLYYEISLVDGYGKVHGRIRREIPEDAAYMGNRIVGEMRASAELGIGLVSFGEACRIMHTKEFRRDLMADAARQCSLALCDFLEDREGWHGVDRQDTAEELHKRGGRS